MKKENYNYNLIRFKENFTYNQQLNTLTVFPHNNFYNQNLIYKVIINFSLKDLDFNKKKALPFFLAIELLTNQKCIATLSSKNILLWKLRKGALVGCKVTLRKKNLYEFFDLLTLTLPRMEKFQGLDFNQISKNTTKSFSLKLTELILFYPIELGLGINTDVKKIEINFLFKNLSNEEKLFLLTTLKIPLKK